MGIRKPYAHLILFVFFVHSVIQAVFGNHYEFTSGQHDLMGFINTVWITDSNRFDSGFFEEIARSGYSELIRTPFFPMYPLLILILHKLLFLSVPAASALLSNVMFLLSLFGVYQLVLLDFDEKYAKRTVWIYALFPTAFFFTVFYSESTFMAFGIWCIYFARKGKWGVSALLAAFAILTRNTGVLFVIVLAIEYMQSVGWNFKKVRFPVILIALSPLSIFLYMGYLKWISPVRDALAFVHAETIWHRSFYNPLFSLIGGFHLLFYPYPDNPLRHLSYHGFEAATVLLILLILTIVLVKKEIRLSYAIYWILALWIPLCNPIVHFDYFLSMPRFVLTMFPLFIYLGWYLKKRWQYWTYISVSLVSCGFLFNLFSNSLFVG